MRFLSPCYLIVAIFMAGSIMGTACLQHYMSKVSITLSCEDPTDEDASDWYEDDKEHATHVIAFINPPLIQSPELYYQDQQSNHAVEISVPPPEV